MNVYRFYNKGEHFVSIWGNKETENFISSCADLTRIGFTPEYWHNPDTGKDILVYTDSFKLERINAHGKLDVITPETIGILAKTMQKELSAFDYDYASREWVAKKDR